MLNKPTYLADPHSTSETRSPKTARRTMMIPPMKAMVAHGIQSQRVHHNVKSQKPMRTRDATLEALVSKPCEDEMRGMSVSFFNRSWEVLEAELTQVTRAAPMNDEPR